MANLRAAVLGQGCEKLLAFVVQRDVAGLTSLRQPHCDEARCRVEVSNPQAGKLSIPGASDQVTTNEVAEASVSCRDKAPAFLI